MKTIFTWTLGILFWHSVCFAIAPAVLDINSDPVSLLVAKLERIDLIPYYGTALLFSFSKDELYYVTNAHLLPTKRSDDQSLRLRTPLHQYQADKSRVLGFSMAHDLAVIAVPRSERDLPFSNLLKPLLAEVLEQQSSAREWKRLAILGYPSAQSSFLPVLKSNPWTMEITDPLSPGRYTGGAPDPLPLSESLFVRSASFCPAPFLKECYEIPFRTWGFSGSPVLSESFPIINGLSKISHFAILGLISHYSPLTDTSWVLPLPEILPEALRLLEKGKQQLFIETQDESGIFEIVQDGVVRILKGPLRNYTVYSPDAEEGSKGGFESSGGRHAFGGYSKGGFESSGGGGEVPNFQVRDWPALLEELVKPENWIKDKSAVAELLRSSPQFRGIDQFLGFFPGVNLCLDRKCTWIDSLAERLISNLPSFLKFYKAEPTMEFKATAPQFYWPRRLGEHRSRYFGVHSRTDLVPVKELLLPTLGLTTHLSIPVVYSHPKQTQIQFYTLDPKGEPIEYRIDWPGSLVSLTSHYARYTGKFWVKRGISPAQKGFGVATLNFMPSENSYELKLVVYTPGSDGRMSFESFYLPLSEERE